jgi:hypothetical protein
LSVSRIMNPSNDSGKITYLISEGAA